MICSCEKTIFHMSAIFFEKLIVPQGSVAYSTTFSMNNLRYFLYDFVSLSRCCGGILAHSVKVPPQHFTLERYSTWPHI